MTRENPKYEKKTEICWNEKKNTKPQANETCGDKSEYKFERRETSKIPRQDQVTQKTRKFENNGRKFCQLVGGECTTAYEQTDAKGNKLGVIYGERNELNRKAEGINDMEKELQGPEEVSVVEIHSKVLNSVHDSIHVFWFQKFSSIRDRLTLRMNICLEETDILEWMTKGKTTLIQKDPKKELPPTTIQV